MERFKDAVATWRGPVLYGLFTALVIWTVWYFTKTPCIMANADAGLCNPSALANFINLEVLIKAGGGGLTVGTLKGGYNTYMLNKMLNTEREARIQAEQQLVLERQRAEAALQEERQKADEERQKANEERQKANEERQKANEERQKANEERQKADEERRKIDELIREFREERQQFATTQQAVLDTLAQLVQQRNGNEQPDSQ